jgi:carbon storage regulator
MLVFTRKVGDQIQIGEDIELTVEKIGKNHVDIGISAPNEYTIQRRQMDSRTPNASESDINQQMPSV